jgi:hypothetical protein
MQTTAVLLLNRKSNVISRKRLQTNWLSRRDIFTRIFLGVTNLSTEILLTVHIRYSRGQNCHSKRLYFPLVSLSTTLNHTDLTSIQQSDTLLWSTVQSISLRSGICQSVRPSVRLSVFRLRRLFLRLNSAS